METQAGDKVSTQQKRLNEVLEKINEIARVSATGNYIYRGEPAHYQEAPYNGRVTSGLYRQYLENDIEAEHFDVAVVQADILRAAHEYTPHKMDDFEILATLQHFGDKTNLIDFTTDYLVALFFACDGNPKKPGRVILLPREPEGDPEAYEVKKPPRTIRRAETQKSIFVEAPKGVVEPDRIVIVTIPAHLKSALLDYLRNHHDISTKTIYNDLQGFIENRGLHENAYTEFYTGLTYQERADSAKTEVERQEGHEDAIIYYEAAIDKNPEYAEAYNNRGSAYAQKGDFDTAIQDFSKAIALNPEYALAYSNRGGAYAQKGDFDTAIQDFSKAIALNPDLADAYYNRGVAYADKGEVDTALQDYTKAIALAPENAKAYNNRGIAHAATGDFAAAIEDYTKAIELAPDLAEVYNNRGNAYAKKGDFAAAIADYNKAIALAPEDAEIYYNHRGIAHAATSDFAAAIEDYTKAIALAPEYVDVYNNRGIAHAATDDFAAAFADYNKAIALAPEDAKAYHNRGAAYRATGDFAAAIKDYTKTIALAPEYAKAYNNRGKAWLHLKDWEKTRADLTTAKDKGVDIIASFQNDYESVEAFEEKNGVKMPADIAALLQH